MAQATPDAEQVVQAHTKMWNEQDETRIPTVLSETYTEYNPVMPGGELHGRDEFRDWFQQITTAFPDFQVEMLDLLADETTVMAEPRFRMTHEGEFGGVPPTGRTVEFTAMVKYLVEDGQVEELRNYVDTGDLFEQLGVTADQGPV